MADNTTLDPGTGGDVIATDDVAGVKYQRTKLTDGTADSTTAIAAGGGVEAAALRVTVATDSTGVLSVDDNGSTLSVDDGAGSLTVDNGGTFATQDSQKVTDNAAFTDGTTPVQPAGYIFDEVAGTSLTENDAGAARMDAKRSQVTVLEDATTRGQRASVSAGGALKVDASGAAVPITDNSGSLTVDNGGTFAVQIAANSSVNVTQVAGTTTDTNSGVKSAGTQRVVLATDQPQLTNALKVDGSAVTQPVSGTVTANLGTAAVTNAGTFATQESQLIADDAAFTVATSKVFPVGYLADQASTDSVNEGDIGAARMTLDRKQISTLAPSVDTEGATIGMNIDVDESEDAVKTSAGKILGWYMYNDGAAEVYVKFYNDTVANVVVGTTVPVLTIPVPAGSATNVSFADMGGIPFSAAITIAATTGVTTADTGAPAANQVIANVLYV